MTLKDADFLKSGQQNNRYIAAVVGIPATLLATGSLRLPDWPGNQFHTIRTGKD